MIVSDKSLILKHELFALDSNLKNSLDKHRYAEITKSLIDDLMTELGMEELAPLGIYMATDSRAPGWSFIQPITTSHISGHYFEKPGNAPHIHVDVYSCAPFSYQKIISVLHRHLQMTEWVANFICREMDLSERSNCTLHGIGETVNLRIDLAS